MSLRLKKVAVFVAANATCTIAGHFLLKLIDNAVLSWVDNQIADLIGISGPNISTVVSWVLPFLLGFIILVGYHVVQSLILKTNAAPMEKRESINISVAKETHPGDRSVGRVMLPSGVPSADLSVLYEEYDVGNNKTALRLRFLPDTDTYEADAVLVLCYVYKRVRGIDKLRCAFVDSQINNLLRHAPNAQSKNPFAFLQMGIESMISTMIASHGAAQTAIKKDM